MTSPRSLASQLRADQNPGVLIPSALMYSPQRDPGGSRLLFFHVGVGRDSGHNAGHAGLLGEISLAFPENRQSEKRGSGGGQSLLGYGITVRPGQRDSLASITACWEMGAPGTPRIWTQHSESQWLWLQWWRGATLYQRLAPCAACRSDHRFVSSLGMGLESGHSGPVHSPARSSFQQGHSGSRSRDPALGRGHCGGGPNMAAA